MAEFDLAAWQRALASGSEEQLEFDANVPIVIDVNVARLALLKTDFENVAIRGGRTAGGWALGLSGAELNGELALPRSNSEVAELNPMGPAVTT